MTRTTQTRRRASARTAIVFIAAGLAALPAAHVWDYTNSDLALWLTVTLAGIGAVAALRLYWFCIAPLFARV